MKIAWIFPVNKHCGISLYAHDYCADLSALAEVRIFDIDTTLADISQNVSILNTFDCIHIQYETSFFLNKNDKQLQQLCKLITRPIFVSLHEVYENFPSTFPRENISGSGFLRKYKELIYDFQHPYQTTYMHHLSNGFFGDKLLVHAQYHKDILMRHGITHDNIIVVPLPIKPQPGATFPPYPPSSPLRLVSHGFITPTYDFDLLFATLEALQLPWQFTWIGGARRESEQPLLQAINERIKQHEWQDKFKITGWVPEPERNQLLAYTDIFLALFEAKSSSASLATALAARRYIVTTDLPCTQEYILNGQTMILCPASSEAVIERINRLCTDVGLRRVLAAAIDSYINAYSCEKLAQYLIYLYQENMR